MTVSTSCGWIPDQYHRLSPISTESRLPYSTMGLISGGSLDTWPKQRYDHNLFQSLFFSKGINILLLFKPQIRSHSSLSFNPISPLPMSSVHSTSNYTQNLVSYLHLSDASLTIRLPPAWLQSPCGPFCLHSCQRVLYFLNSKMYILFT